MEYASAHEVLLEAAAKTHTDIFDQWVRLLKRLGAAGGAFYFDSDKNPAQVFVMARNAVDSELYLRLDEAAEPGSALEWFQKFNRRPNVIEAAIKLVAEK